MATLASRHARAEGERRVLRAMPRGGRRWCPGVGSGLASATASTHLFLGGGRGSTSSAYFLGRRTPTAQRSRSVSPVTEILDMPSYGIPEAAGYLLVPVTTLRSWFLGQFYQTTGGRKLFDPPLAIAQREPALLSFTNLVEAHVLDAIRRQHGVSLQNVRRALRFVERHFPSDHPLAHQTFETDGLDLFIQHYGKLINASQEGQFTMRALVAAYLRRVERNPSGAPIRLYPYIRHRAPEEPKSIVIDPRVSFGRPVLTGTGIATEVVASRYKAGESIDDLADDYGKERGDIEEAIRYTLQIHAKAA